MVTTTSSTGSSEIGSRAWRRPLGRGGAAVVTHGAAAVRVASGDDPA
jgi:hypothetical protein